MEEWRSAVWRRLGAIAALAACGAAQACELPAGKRLEGQQYLASYRTIPARIPLGEHFVVELSVCPRLASQLPSRIELNAHMPEHRHGMNYRPQVAALGDGSYRSEGWLFHMPGRWEFVFELGGERFVDSVRIE